MRGVGQMIEKSGYNSVSCQSGQRIVEMKHAPITGGSWID